MMRRLKEDFNQHYNQLDCPCRYDKKVQARMADTPKAHSCYQCDNPRKVFKGKKSAALTFQELKANILDYYERQLGK